jgi:HprK-related kinase A
VTVAEVPRRDLATRLRAGRFRFRVGPFLVALHSTLDSVVQSVANLYCHHAVEPDGPGAHFVVSVDPPGWSRRYLRRQVQLDVEGTRPFLPLPVAMAPMMLEGGLNWCIGSLANHLVSLHAATLERDGVGLVMPAHPGAGKSTLCAALATRGWRLLSDEFALVHPETGELLPVPRPVALKDRSITILREWAPDAWFGPEAVNNEGQLTAYMRPSADSVRASARRCRPGLVVVPRFREGAPTRMEHWSRARAVAHLAHNSFNYNLHGRVGFERICDLAEAAPAVLLEYSRLDEGVRAVDQLARELGR